MPMLIKPPQARKPSALRAVAVIALVAILGSYVISNSRAAALVGDLNNDGIVNVLDLSILLSGWGTANTTADLNTDGTVNVFDLSILLSHWGQTGPTPTPTVQLLQNGSFETTGVDWQWPWRLNVQPGAAGALTQASSTKTDGNYSAQINVTQFTNPWDVQLGQTVPLTAGQTYTIKFSAKADSSRSMGISVQGGISPYPNYYVQTVALTTAWQQFTYSFTAPTTDSIASLFFNVAQATGTVWLDNVSVTTNATPTPSPVPSSTATPTPGQFTALNGAFYDPSGAVFIPRGINTLDAQLGYYTNIYTLFPNLNFVRLAACSGVWINPCPYNGSSGDTAASVTPFVNYLTSRHVVVMIEDHINDFSINTTQAEYNWYASMASAFNGNPYVWFETTNEPNNAADQSLAQEQQAIYNAIRGTGNPAPVIFMRKGGSVTNFSNYPSNYSSMVNVGVDSHDYGDSSQNGVGPDEYELTNAVPALQNSLPPLSEGIPPAIIGEYGPSESGGARSTNYMNVITAVQQCGGKGICQGTATPPSNMEKAPGNLTNIMVATSLQTGLSLV